MEEQQDRDRPRKKVNTEQMRLHGLTVRENMKPGPCIATDLDRRD